MKKQVSILLLLLSASNILISSCKKDNATEEPAVNTRMASFNIGSIAYTVAKPYIGIFNSAGVINNTMTLTATDGSKIEFNFKGSSPSTYQLMSFSNGYYKNAAGKQYNSTSGELVISSYTVDGANYIASGTFHFKAKAIAAPIDSLEITSGIITNASNEF